MKEKIKKIIRSFEKLSVFEKWQIVLSAITIVILFFTFCGAIVIGSRQNEINQSLVDLSFLPSVRVTHDEHTNWIQVLNTGDKNILVGPIVIYDNSEAQDTNFSCKDSDLRLIVPGGYYNFFVEEQFNKSINSFIEQWGEKEEFLIPFDVFLKSVTGQEYVVNNLFYIRFKNESREVYTQTSFINKSKWCK